MDKEYTAKEIIQLIKKCNEDVEKYKELYRFINTISINKDEMEKLLENEDYNIFYTTCYRIKCKNGSV